MQEQPPKKNEPYEYHFFGVESLREPAARIVNDLYPELEAGTYSLILGDDASGRIPTLLMGKISSSIYRENGNPPPEIRFITGSKGLTMDEREQKKRDIAEYFEKIRETMTGKVLIVTDVIDTGVSLDPVIEVLQEKGIDFDIASIGDVTTQDVEGRWGREVYFGQQELPHIFGDQFSSGVHKNARELFSHPEKESPDYTEEEKIDLQRNINEAREDVDHLADEILVAQTKMRQKRPK